MKINTIIKFGGSITERGTLKQIVQLGKTLSSLFDRKQNFAIIPGGGLFAEFVRETQEKYSLDDEQAHWMAIQAMEQHASLLLKFMPNSILHDFASKDFEALIFDELPILRVMKYMRTESDLEKTWNSTSDAIATEIALKIKAEKIVFLKDIDGVIVKDKLVKKITIQELLELKTSPLDNNTPKILQRKNIKAYIINGLIHYRIENLLEGKEFIGTEIIC
ncbi:MAG: hypothetical protein E3J70_08105 [Candidatus Heimdallarchaeota archaeon]|nr:MAG: hypothetical protein E3J70_08105 [Candidatus Heimdallarchaeota archaeon]